MVLTRIAKYAKAPGLKILEGPTRGESLSTFLVSAGILTRCTMNRIMLDLETLGRKPGCAMHPATIASLKELCAESVLDCMRETQETMAYNALTGKRLSFPFEDNPLRVRTDFGSNMRPDYTKFLYM